MEPIEQGFDNFIMDLMHNDLESRECLMCGAEFLADKFSSDMVCNHVLCYRTYRGFN